MSCKRTHKRNLDLPGLRKVTFRELLKRGRRNILNRRRRTLTRSHREWILSFKSRRRFRCPLTLHVDVFVLLVLAASIRPGVITLALKATLLL